MPQTTAPASNRRKQPRRSPKGWTKATCHKGSMQMGANLALKILDVAESGICLVVRDPLANSQEVVVTLESPNHRRPLTFSGRVMWCVATAEGTHCIGVQFDKRLSYGDLAKLT
ncbi:MAG TPA: PilZ domain-containing protein [Gemmataceae bacterium]|nr:PilZ domain-containing protein [Gemmataceae bacterium]